MNEQLKPYKTVEQIAKKHRMDVSDIQKQLDMGAPIEHEHTNNQKLAVEIALQHLDEIPDYYTRLKKMEASAKKEHKKFKDVKEENLRKWFGDSKSKEGKPGWVNVVTGGTCASDEPGEGVPKCVSSEKRASMTKAERLSAARRKKSVDKNQQSKSGAAKPTYVSTDKPEKKMNEEKDIKGKGSGKKDACYSKVKSRYSVWPSAYASGALVKCRKVGAANWGNKSESINILSKDSISEEMGMMRYCPKCEKDETREECRYGPKYWDMFSVPSSLSPNQIKFSIAQVHPANESKEPDHEYSMARSELSTIISAAKRLRGKLNGEGNIEAWVQSKITKAADYIDAAADYLDSGEHNVQGSMDEACWKGYKKKGMKTMFGKRYPDCVKVIKVKESNDVYSNWREDFGLNEASAAWQRKAGKNPEGGLNAKGVASYRAQNPGSKLQTAVTTKPSKLKPGSKDAKRRKSFCARMGGNPGPMKDEKGRPTRKALSLRKWNCN
jgi:hypothetical protein